MKSSCCNHGACVDGPLEPKTNLYNTRLDVLHNPGCTHDTPDDLGCPPGENNILATAYHLPTTSAIYTNTAALPSDPYADLCNPRPRFMTSYDPSSQGGTTCHYDGVPSNHPSYAYNYLPCDVSSNDSNDIPRNAITNIPRNAIINIPRNAVCGGPGVDFISEEVDSVENCSSVHSRCGLRCNELRVKLLSIAQPPFSPLAAASSHSVFRSPTRMASKPASATPYLQERYPHQPPLSRPHLFPPEYPCVCHLCYSQIYSDALFALSSNADASGDLSPLSDYDPRVFSASSRDEPNDLGYYSRGPTFNPVYSSSRRHPPTFCLFNRECGAGEGSAVPRYAPTSSSHGNRNYGDDGARRDTHCGSRSRVAVPRGSPRTRYSANNTVGELGTRTPGKPDNRAPIWFPNRDGGDHRPYHLVPDYVLSAHLYRYLFLPQRIRLRRSETNRDPVEYSESHHRNPEPPVGPGHRLHKPHPEPYINPIVHSDPHYKFCHTYTKTHPPHQNHRQTYESTITSDDLSTAAVAPACELPLRPNNTEHLLDSMLKGHKAVNAILISRYDKFMSFKKDMDDKNINVS